MPTLKTVNNSLCVCNGHLVTCPPPCICPCTWDEVHCWNVQLSEWTPPPCGSITPYPILSINFKPYVCTTASCIWAPDEAAPMVSYGSKPWGSYLQNAGMTWRLRVVQTYLCPRTQYYTNGVDIIFEGTMWASNFSCTGPNVFTLTDWYSPGIYSTHYRTYTIPWGGQAIWGGTCCFPSVQSPNTIIATVTPITCP